MVGPLILLQTIGPKYVDLTVSPDGRWLAFGYEKEIPQKEAINQIGVIDLSKNEVQEAVENIEMLF